MEKQCPFCCETIDSSSLRCPHCGEVISENAQICIHCSAHLSAKPVKEGTGWSTTTLNLSLFSCAICIAMLCSVFELCDANALPNATIGEKFANIGTIALVLSFPLMSARMAHKKGQWNGTVIASLIVALVFSSLTILILMIGG